MMDLLRPVKSNWLDFAFLLLTKSVCYISCWLQNVSDISCQWSVSSHPFGPEQVLKIFQPCDRISVRHTTLKGDQSTYVKKKISFDFVSVGM